MVCTCGRGHSRLRHGRTDHRACSDEAIPAPVHRLNKPRCLRIIPQHPPQLTDADVQGRLLHHRLGPDGREQLLFGHQATWVGDEIAQHGKAFRPQVQHLGPMPHTLVTQIHTEWATVHLVCFRQCRLLARARPGDVCLACCRLGLKPCYRSYGECMAKCWPFAKTSPHPIILSCVEMAWTPVYHNGRIPLAAPVCLRYAWRDRRISEMED